VCEAADGASVVERLSEGTRLFDVIVLDYRLPDSNDLHLLETVRRLAPDSTVIMTTAFGSPETLAGALRLGVYRVVPKPFDVHDLARLVAEAPRSDRGASVGWQSIQEATMAEKTFTESFRVAGEQLVDAVKRLFHEGNVRRVIIKHEGNTVVEFPLTVGVIGAVLAPVLAAVGAIAAALKECTVEVERVEPPSEKKGAA